MSSLFVISGAAGMTGSELSSVITEELTDAVIGFDNFFCSSMHTIEGVIDRDNFIFHEWDINSSEHMNKLRDEIVSVKSKYENVIFINCAAVVHTKYFYHVNDTFETNVLGMKTFLDMAISIGADTYINCSTSEVYSMDSYKEGGVAEGDFLSMATVEHSQRTSYATGKLMTEFFLKDAVDEGKIKGCSIRFANVYSKNELFADHIIPHIITSLMKDGGVTLLENSRENRRTFLHNIDSCAAVLALANEESALDGTVYNVATDEEVTILELVKMCADTLEIREPKIVFEGHRDSDPIRRVLNTDKIRTRTTWRPVIGLKEGIKMCVEDKNES